MIVIRANLNEILLLKLIEFLIAQQRSNVINTKQSADETVDEMLKKPAKLHEIEFCHSSADYKMKLCLKKFN